MSVNMDQLTNAELQRKLRICGFPNTPVTETTREVLIRKLKKHIQGESTMNGKQSLNFGSKSRSRHNNYFHESNNHFLNHCTPQSRTKIYSRQNNIGLNTDNYRTEAHAATLSKISTSPLFHYDSESDGDQYNSCSYRKVTTNNSKEDTTTKYNLQNTFQNNGGGGDGAVVGRLLRLRGSTLQKKTNNSGCLSNDLSRNKPIKRSWWLSVNYLKKYMQTKPDFHQFFIPYALIGGMIVFFLFIATVYLSRRHEQGLIEENATHYTLCKEPKIAKLKSHLITCIDDDIITTALDSSKKLLTILNERAKKNECGYEKYDTVVRAADLWQILRASNRNFNLKISDLLCSVIYLISQNPQWNIKTLSTQEDISSMAVEKISFELAKRELSLKCIIINKAKRFFFILGSLGLTVIIFVITYVIIQYFRNKKKEKLLAVEQFIKDIINELNYQASIAENQECNEIFVNDLRDELIPTTKRKKLLCFWNEALRLLEENDSRVLFSVVVKNGEEQRTISLNLNAEHRGTSQKKKWQSPAFDNSNKIENPPTPCLKIRHMFDASEVNQPNLKQSITNAIYEKVGKHCKINDIQIDKQSCCVYLRCASEHDAGIVHNAINGWWFDKRLISIKFLRLERYLTRFPKSPNYPLCFLSSNLINSHQH